MQDNDSGRTRLDLVVGSKPPGFTAIGIFLFFGAVMASLAATTLLWRGTALNRLWALNPMALPQPGRRCKGDEVAESASRRQRRSKGAALQFEN